MCSFCYFCGKEFDISEYKSHECRVHNFDSPDSVEGLEESENDDDTLKLLTTQKEEANVVTQNNKTNLQSSAIHRQNITLGTNEIKNKKKSYSSTKVIKDSERSIHIPGLVIQPTQSNSDTQPIAIIEIKEGQENAIVESVSENVQMKNNDPITKQSISHQSLHGTHLVNPNVSLDLTVTADLPDEVKKTTHKSDLPSLGIQNSTLDQDTSSNSINTSVSLLNFSKPIYHHPGTLFPNVESSNFGRNVDTDNSEMNQSSCSSEAKLSSFNTVTKNTDSCEKLPPSEETFCEFCGLLVSNIKDLQAHQLILHELEHFLCFLCENSFNETNELINHLKVKHRERDVVKAEVNYVTMGMFKNNRIYYCNQCGQGFNLIHKLLSHKRELIKLGKHFFEVGLRTIWKYLESPQKKSVKGHTLSSKRKTIDFSKNEKGNKKIKGGAQGLGKMIINDNKAQKNTENSSCHADSTKKPVSVEHKHEIGSEASNNKNNEKRCLIQNSERKRVEDQKDNRTKTDQNLKQSSSNFECKIAENDKKIRIRSINTKKDEKQKTSSLISEKENKKNTETQNHQVLLTIKSKQIKENKHDSNTKITNETTKQCEKSSENKNTGKKIQLKSSSKGEKVKDRKQDNNKRDDDRRSKSSSCTSQKIYNIDHIITVDNRIIIKNKQDLSKQKNTDNTNKFEQDQVQGINNEPEKTQKYKEKNIIPKGFKIKPLCVLLKREKIENMTSKRTSESEKKTKDKKLITTDQRDKKTRLSNITGSSDRNIDSHRTTKSNANDNIVKTTESLLRIKDNKLEKLVKRTEIAHTQTTDKVKKLKESLIKMQAIKIKERAVNSQDNNINNTYNKSSDKVKKTLCKNEIIDKQMTTNLKNPSKYRTRIISECDIFSANQKPWAEVKKKSQFTKEKNIGTIKQISGKESLRNGPNKNDSNENDYNKQDPSRNNFSILEHSKKEIEEENKKKLSLQQYKDIRDIVSHQSQDPSPIIINVPQLSEHNMKIINEAVQKFGISNTALESNLDAAKFSDNDDNVDDDVESSQENIPIIYCEACGSQCQNSDHLKGHMAFMHQGFQFVCFVCDHNFSTLDAVISHQVKYSKDILMSAESQFLRRRKSTFYPYYCNHCGKGFTLIDLVAIHKKENHNKQIKIRKIVSTNKAADDKGKSIPVKDDNQNTEDEEVSILMTSALNTPEGSRRNSLEITEDETNAKCNSRHNNVIPFINTEDNYVKHNILVTSSSKTSKNVSLDQNFPRFCESCGREHLSFEDQQIDLHLEKFKCIICLSPYETIDLLVTHYDLRHPKHEIANFEYAQRSIHKNNYSFYCKFCGKGFYFIGELLGHRECKHFELLQKEKDDQVAKNNCEKTITNTCLTKTTIGRADTVTTKHTNLIVSQTSFEKDYSLTFGNDVKNNESLENNVTNNKTKLNIDFTCPSKPDVGYKEVAEQNSPQKKRNTDIFNSTIHQVDLNNKFSKNDKEIDLTNISDNDRNFNSQIIDLENISSSEELEEGELSNFVDVEEFIKEKEQKTQNEKSNKKPVNPTKSLKSFKSDEWDDLAKQIADELEKEDLLNDSQGEKLIIKDPVSIPTDDNLLENCHEDVVEILPSAQNYINQDKTPSFCEACGQKFPSKKKSKHHFTHNHELFRCSVCAKRFIYLHKLIKHQNCKYKLSTLEYAEKESLRLLLSREVPEHFRYYCGVCGKGFNYIYDLKSHKDLNCPVQTIEIECDTSFSSKDKEHHDGTITLTSETNILEDVDFNDRSSSEATSEHLSTNKTSMSTVQNPKNIKTTEKKPTCNSCGKIFSLWHLLNEHRVHGCTDKKPQDITTLKKHPDKTCNAHLNCQNSTLIAASRNENVSKEEKHSCLSCGQSFLYTCELTWHTFKGCRDLNTTSINTVQSTYTPQISSKGSNVSIPLEFLNNVPLSTAVKPHLTSKSIENAKPFKCSVCLDKVFSSEDGLKQHSKFSQKHIQLAKLKKEMSFKNLNLPLTYLITETVLTTSNQSVNPSNLSKTPQLLSLRTRSRSPPRSRKRTKLSDRRRRSIEREVETKEKEDKSKKKRRRPRKRQRRRSESKEREVKRPRCDESSESITTEKMIKNPKSIQKFENASGHKNDKKHVDKETDNSSFERKKENDVDNLEGIYTLKEMEKMYP